MKALIRPETSGADISTPDKSEELISLLDEYIDYIEEENKKIKEQLEKDREDLKLPIGFIKHITGIKQKRLINKKWKEWLTQNQE